MRMPDEPDEPDEAIEGDAPDDGAPPDDEPPGEGPPDEEPPGADAGTPEPTAATDPPAGRRRRRGRRILAWSAGVVAIVVLAAVGAAAAVYVHLNHNIHSSNITKDLGTSRPPDLHPRAENIVVIGSDSRQGTDGQYGTGLYTDQSDTLMIVHLAADRKWATVVSIPRDSYVRIPSCVMGNGQTHGPTEYKINEAFAIGNLGGNKTALGAACTIKTIEQDTGVRIDHFVVVNFLGFQSMVNALGGVWVCTPAAIYDPLSGLSLTAGRHLLMGTQALGYVRARYTLGNGSDLERIGRQQDFMSSLATRAKSKLYDPVAMYGFLDAVTKSLTTDSGLGSVSALASLAGSVKDIPTNAVTFVTLPNYPRSLVVPSDTANVLWQQPQAGQVFASMRDDTPLGPAAAPSPSSSGAPSRPAAPSSAPSSAPPSVAGRTAAQAACT
jgi:LCP family protein required for cell wall assembly